MHILRNPVPWDRKTCAVGAENGIRRVFRIAQRVIAQLRNDLLRIVAGSVALRKTAQPPLPARIGRKLGCIALHFRHRHAAAELHPAGRFLRRAEGAGHGADVVDCAAELFGRHCQGKTVIRLQQNAPGLHQPLPDGAVGRLTEIAALGVLEMSAAGGQRQLHIRNRRAGQNTGMCFFLQVCQNQPLPVAVEDILAARAAENQPAASGQRLQKKMHLRIMAQRLKVPDAFHGGGNGLAVGNAAGIDRDLPAEAFRDQAFHDLKLNLSHELKLKLPELLVPCNVKLRLLLFQLAQLGQRRAHVALRRQIQTVSHDGIQKRTDPLRLCAEHIARTQRTQSGNRADLARRNLIHGLKTSAGILPELDDLLLHGLAAARRVGNRCADAQTAAGDLEPCQTAGLLVTGDLINTGGKRLRIDRRHGKAPQCLQKLPDARQVERRAKKAGEECLPPHQICDGCVAESSLFQIERQCPLVAQCDGFKILRLQTAFAQTLRRLRQKSGAIRTGQIHFIKEKKGRNLIPA